ncbi:MAG: pilin [Patescibacteria group bacterium]
MLSKLKILVISLFAAALPLGLPVVGSSTVLAQETPAPGGSSETTNIENRLCQGADLKFDSDASNCDTTAATDDINNIVTTIIDIFSWIIGVVAVIMIIYAGFKYITSGGDQAGVKAAKDTILYAIIGLVVVALAQTIVRFVLGRV